MYIPVTLHFYLRNDVIKKLQINCISYSCVFHFPVALTRQVFLLTLNFTFLVNSYVIAGFVRPHLHKRYASLPLQEKIHPTKT